MSTPGAPGAVPVEIMPGHEPIHAWRMMVGRRIVNDGWEEAMTTGIDPFCVPADDRESRAAGRRVSQVHGVPVAKVSWVDIEQALARQKFQALRGHPVGTPAAGERDASSR